MPPEPKRSIEELLKTSAEARRAAFGPEPEMPNPMRARLHEEIVRQNRVAEPATRPSWLARFWPQISVVTAMAVLLITGSLVWLKSNSGPGNGNLTLAMKESANQPKDAGSLLKSLPAVAPQIAKEETASSALADAAAAGGGLTKTEAKPSAEVTLAQAGVRRDEEAASLPSNEAFASAPAAAPAPMAAKSKSSLTNREQHFTQTARGQTLRNQANLRRTANVLDNFQVEQDGRQIRLVDADGSTYSGEITAVPAEPNAKLAARTRAMDATAQTQDGLYFRASGFNTSLQKRVTFEGNYIPVSPNEQKESAAPGQSSKAEPINARIVGTAQVVGEAPVAVDAVSVNP